MAIVCLGSHAIPIVNEDWHLPKGRAFLPGNCKRIGMPLLT
jgi:hypothetical protein